MAEIDLDDYTEEEIDEYLGAYGFDNPGSQETAEAIFETELPSNMLDHTYPSYDDAREFLRRAMDVDCEMPDETVIG